MRLNAFCVALTGATADMRQVRFSTMICQSVFDGST